jgi:hypothetical protein
MADFDWQGTLAACATVRGGAASGGSRRGRAAFARASRRVSRAPALRGVRGSPPPHARRRCLPAACAAQGAPDGTVFIAGNVSDGVCLGSFPLDATGNFQLWVRVARKRARKRARARASPRRLGGAAAT